MFSWLFKRDHCPEEEGRESAGSGRPCAMHAQQGGAAARRQVRMLLFLAIFGPQEIGEWIEDESGDTALCPRCGIDPSSPNRTSIR